MLDDIYQVRDDLIKTIEWYGDNLLYDLQLYELGQGQEEFWCLNPYIDDSSIRYYIKDIPYSRKCIVWTYEGQWVVKLFKDGWYPYHGYETYEIKKPTFVWNKNLDIDNLVTYENDPYGIDPHPFDSQYKLIWFIDKRFNPLKEDVWAISCTPVGIEVLGTKFMGYLTPEIEIEYNEYLPKLAVDIDDCYPAFWDIGLDCAWELDPIFQTQKQLWYMKFSPKFRKSKGWKWYGYISPEPYVIQNPILEGFIFDIEIEVPWYDLNYRYVYYLDPSYYQGHEEIWAAKISFVSKPKGNKKIGYIEPIQFLETNDSLNDLKTTIDYKIPLHDRFYEHVWYTNLDNEKVWVAKLKAVDETNGVKEMGEVIPLLPDQLDVIFISYDEINADSNWNRVLEKAPYAKRVHGIKGIKEAHREAARISRTDMFYVVDGDAYLLDNWEFSFQPNLYDRSVGHIWKSINPFNNLSYGYGGVKLFVKSKILKNKKWNTLDFSTTVMKKLKVMDKVSNYTLFNTDEFSTWRSSFREAVKLSKSGNIDYLENWIINENVNFSDYAKLGFEAGKKFYESNKTQSSILTLINDFDWLKTYYQKNLKV